MARLRPSLLLAAAAIICAVTPAFSQDWNKKSFTEWSQGDVIKILNDSPWAQTQVEYADIHYGSPTIAYTATIRLRSALPIRQALLRQKQILMNYHRFTTADKARFDKETAQFVQCSDCVDYYLITLVSARLSDEGRSLGPFQKRIVSFDIVDALGNVTIDEIKSNVYLETDKGERRNAVQFIPAKGEGNEAMFVFPRRDAQGRTLITRDNNGFYFKIEKGLFKGQPMPLKSFKFNVQRLVQNGEIIF